MRRFIIIVFCFILQGCTSTIYVSSNEPNETQALVYFIRQRAEPTMWNLWIYADNNKVASISNNSYVRFNLPIGDRTIRLEWPPLAASVEYENKVVLQPRSTYYFLITGEVGKRSGILFEELKFYEITENHAQELMVLIDS